MSGVVTHSILVVDDDPDWRDMLAVALADEDTIVLTPERPEDAIPLAPDADVAIVDLAMPGMDGLTLIERMRAVAAHLAIVVVTAHAFEPLASEARRLGALAVVAKGSASEILHAARAAMAG